MSMLVALDPGDSTVDITDLSFLDAAGLGCLVRFAEQLAEHGATLRIAGPTARHRRLFNIANLSNLLNP